MPIFRNRNALLAAGAVATSVGALARLGAASGEPLSMTAVACGGALLGSICTGGSVLNDIRGESEADLIRTVKHRATVLAERWEDWAKRSGSTSLSTEEVTSAVLVFEEYFETLSSGHLPTSADILDCGLDDEKLAVLMLDKAAKTREHDYAKNKHDLTLNRNFFLGVMQEAFKHVMAQPKFLDSLQIELAKLASSTNRHVAELGESQHATQLLLQEVASILLGDRSLLGRQHAYAGLVLTPSVLLNPTYAIVPFVGREAEVNYWLDWCENTNRTQMSLGLIHGSGGLGKTRLALEVANRLSTQSGTHWESGFLDLDRVNDEPWRLSWLERTSAPLFVVIDRAESHPEGICHVLSKLWQHQEGRLIRVLLLARSEGDWWRQLAGTRDEIDALKEQPDNRIQALSPLADRAPDRQKLFDAALITFSKVLEKEVINSNTEYDLSASWLDQPLMLQQLALAHTLGKSTDQENKVFEAVLGMERRYWRTDLKRRGHGDSTTAELLEAAAAMLTLSQGSPSRIELKQRIESILNDLGHDSSLANTLTTTLEYFYGDVETRSINALKPDRLGEYLVMVTTERFEQLPMCVMKFPRASGFESTGLDQSNTPQRNTLTVLTRLEKWRPKGLRIYKDDSEGLLEVVLNHQLETILDDVIAVASQTGDPIGKIAAAALERTQNIELAQAFANRLPDHSVSLSELAVTCMSIITKTALQVNSTTEQIAKHAKDLHNLGYRLSEVGRHHDSIAPIQRAIEHFHGLAKNNPKQHIVKVVNSLNTLSACFYHLGQYQEALQESEKAVALSRELTESNAQKYSPDLAQSLSNLSIRYMALEREEDSLTASLEAVKIYRQLAIGDSVKYKRYLAMVLNTLVSKLHASNKSEDALLASDESVKLYRELSITQPDGVLPNMAGALANYARCLFLNQRFDEALTSINEATMISRTLVHERPSMYTSLLLTTLEYKSHGLHELGRNREAAPIAIEVLDICRKLVSQYPGRYEDNLESATALLHNIQLQEPIF